ncbi:MAG: Fic family protein [Bifidobacteriaceae bacterium]|jgi:hypothetical protein|nr:Fic family protein [Bifidobacteriaceae bacterium]
MINLPVVNVDPVVFQFQAKRLISDSVWKAANLELPNGITWPDTNEILEGRVPPGAGVNEVLVVNNLKRAWQFLFDQIEYPLDFATVSQYNRLIGEGSLIRDAGKLRAFGVKISGTDYVPPIPNLEGVSSLLNRLTKTSDLVERGLKTFTEIVRGQWFNDGNKRTAQLAANHILIQNNVGILAVPPDQKLEFSIRLVEYYEKNNFEEFADYLRQYCLEGVIDL